jgi:hypothetical protein
MGFEKEVQPRLEPRMRPLDSGKYDSVCFFGVWDGMPPWLQVISNGWQPRYAAGLHRPVSGSPCIGNIRECGTR